MKNRLLSFLLICILIITSLASGCSPKDESNESVKSTKKAQTGQLTNVFKSKWLTIPDDYEIPILSSSSAAVYNDRIYMLVKHPDDFIEEDGTVSKGYLTVISYDADGGDVQFEEETAYKQVDQFTMLSDGSRVYLRTAYSNSTYKKEYRLDKTDVSGNKLFSVNISAMVPKGSEYNMYGNDAIIDQIAVDAEDRIYLRSESYVITVSPDTGDKLFHIGFDDVSLGHHIRNIIQVGGKMAIEYSDSGHMLKYINADEGKIGDAVYHPKELDLGSTRIFSSRGDNESGVLYYVKTQSGLYSVSAADGEVTEVANWMNSDVSPEWMSDMKVINDDLIYYRGYAPFTYETIRVVLSRVPDDEIVQKTLIEVAYVSGISENSILNVAMKFNQENDKYRVVFTDYKQLSGNLSGDELTSYINRQFALGSFPDVFLIQQYGIPVSQYEDKGLFCDLYEYMDNDSDLSRDKFLKCVLPSGEVDGQLLYLPAAFTVKSVVGKTENVGAMKGWSMSDFLDVAENLSDGIKMLPYQTRSSMYNLLIKYGLIEFIDFEAGTCSFSSDLFIQVLDYIGTLPKTSDSSEYNSEEWQEEFADNTALLKSVSIRDFINYIRNRIDFSTDELTYIGFPGAGDKIEPSLSFAVSAKSDEKTRDGAWEFIKYMLLDKDVVFTTFHNQAFPSTYESFSRFSETERVWNYMVRADGIGASTQEYTQEELDSRGGVPVKLTKEDTDEVLEYLESIEPTPNVYPKVYEIIDEEIQYFFEDAKSAEETANIIQGRVSIYLSESK